MTFCPGRNRSVTARAAFITVLIVLLSAVGCSRAVDKPKSTDFLVTWLQSHGETNIVEDANGVGIGGSATRLRSSLYGSKKHDNGTVTAETEFRVRLPDGREVVEYVAGTGDTLEKAEGDSKLNSRLYCRVSNFISQLQKCTRIIKLDTGFEVKSLIISAGQNYSETIKLDTGETF